MMDPADRARLEALEAALIHLAHSLAAMQRETVAGALAAAAMAAEEWPANELAPGAPSGFVTARAFQRLSDALMREPRSSLRP